MTSLTRHDLTSATQHFQWQTEEVEDDLLVTPDTSRSHLFKLASRSRVDQTARKTRGVTMLHLRSAEVPPFKQLVTLRKGVVYFTLIYFTKLFEVLFEFWSNSPCRKLYSFTFEHRVIHCKGYR